MTPDWKDANGADVNERVLPDGRVLRVRHVGDGRGTTEHYSWIDITGRGLATDECILPPHATRSEAIAAVERAAGLPTLDYKSIGRVVAFAEAVAICERHAAWLRAEHDGADSEMELTARALRKQMLDRQKEEERRPPAQASIGIDWARPGETDNTVTALYRASDLPDSVPVLRAMIAERDARIAELEGEYFGTIGALEAKVEQLEGKKAADGRETPAEASERRLNLLGGMKQAWDEDRNERDILRAQVRALTEENSQARATIVEFQNASGLCVPPEEDGGDPGGVKPKHVERYIAKIEGERDTALADLDAFVGECACASCGARSSAGTSFLPISSHMGDEDIECGSCGSTDTDEIGPVLSQLTSTVDTLRSEQKDLHEQAQSLAGERDTALADLRAMTADRDDLKAQRDAMRAETPDDMKILGHVAMTSMIRGHDAHKTQKRVEADLRDARALLVDAQPLLRAVAQTRLFGSDYEGAARLTTRIDAAFGPEGDK